MIVVWSCRSKYLHSVESKYPVEGEKFDVVVSVLPLLELFVTFGYRFVKECDST